MTKTKQTKCGGSSDRPMGMATVRFSNEGGDNHFEDIPEEEWPDMDNPTPQAVEVGDVSKSTGKAGEGEGSKPVGKPTPTGTEGGTQAPPKESVAPLQAPTDNPQDPQEGTSKGDPQDPTTKPQDPTIKPQDPQAGTSVDDPGLKEYVDSYMQAAQDWFNTVQESKINAYMELYDTLLELGKPHIKDLGKADGTAVLASIAVKSGQFISEVDKLTVYVSKKEKKIQKKPVAVSEKARKSIIEYYKAVQDLCDVQSTFMQRTLEMQAAVNDENIFLEIIRQVQLPAVQVMVRMRSEEEALQGKAYQELSLI